MKANCKAGSIALEYALNLTPLFIKFIISNLKCLNFSQFPGVFWEIIDHQTQFGDSVSTVTPGIKDFHPKPVYTNQIVRI